MPRCDWLAEHERVYREPDGVGHLIYRDVWTVSHNGTVIGVAYDDSATGVAWECGGVCRATSDIPTAIDELRRAWLERYGDA